MQLQRFGSNMIGQIHLQNKIVQNISSIKNLPKNHPKNSIYGTYLSKILIGYYKINIYLCIKYKCIKRRERHWLVEFLFIKFLLHAQEVITCNTNHMVLINISK